jgi:hypothetical protein
MRTLFARVAGDESGTVVVEPVAAVDEAAAGGALTRYTYAYRPDPETATPGEVIGPYDSLQEAIDGARNRFGDSLDELQAVPAGVDPWAYAGGERESVLARTDT